MLENSYYALVIECDENGPVNYEYDCKTKRMNSIYEQIGLLTVFIRYNPDKENYRSKEFKKKFENKK